MLRGIKGLLILLIIVQGQCLNAARQENAALRLVPFPKQLNLQKGLFALDAQLVFETPVA